jgi:hypothetical protein
MAAFGPAPGQEVTQRGGLPRVLQAALDSPGGTCYRHCDRPLRIRRISSRLPGNWQVRACPSGVVSVTVYTEWARRDPSRAVRTQLQRWTIPPSSVRPRDLRLATRHGPELGPAAEQLLAAARPAREVRVVYWRVYPFRERDGIERRLMVCLRRTHASPVFFVAAPTTNPGCPVCARRRTSKDRRPKRRVAGK